MEEIVKVTLRSWVFVSVLGIVRKYIEEFVIPQKLLTVKFFLFLCIAPFVEVWYFSSKQLRR